MFKEIFLFEIIFRLKKPAIYIYTLIPFLITVYAFSTGSVAAGEGQFYNAPAVVARFITVMSFFMVLLISSLMGPAIYRDIEYQTASYYLSYPISKSGYFFGRFTGTFLFILLSGIHILAGAFAGSALGPILGLSSVEHFGSNTFYSYLLPFLIFLLPNMLLCSCLFFGMVAITQNTKVIYSGGIILLLAYMGSRVYFDFTDNSTFSQLADPFAYNSVRLITSVYTPEQINKKLINFNGLLLLNRIIWCTITITIVIITYTKFSLRRFFLPKLKSKLPEVDHSRLAPINLSILFLKSSFGKSYFRKTLASLTKIEVLSIFRDNFFWIIIISTTLFEGFVFWLGAENYQVRDVPRTVALINIFKNSLFPYLFIIVAFYTGEVIHRENSTKFNLINDTLPPATRMFFLAKGISLFIMGAFITALPTVVSIIIQLSKGYTEFNFQVYLENYFLILLPQLTEMIMLSILVHIIVNQKFSGHVICIVLWFGSTQLIPGYTDINYHLLLYSTAPFFNFSDMESAGHMIKSINWFNLYWIVTGCLFLIFAYLLYPRGIITSFHERIKLLQNRFDVNTKSILLAFFFLSIFSGSYIYYNVSVINSYQTEEDEALREVKYERVLKRFEKKSQPSIIYLKLNECIYPKKQAAGITGEITLFNPTKEALDSVLFDGEALNNYELSFENKQLKYTQPLIYLKPSYSIFGNNQDTSNCRIYKLPIVLQPGDSTKIQICSRVFYQGFQNELYGTDITGNGTFFNGGIPQIGYDWAKEISNNDLRLKYHLKSKFVLADGMTDTSVFIKPNRQLRYDLTISTSEDQKIVAAGELINQWQKGNRKYYHYLQNTPGSSMPLTILSANYVVKKFIIPQLNGYPITAKLFYHPQHNRNLSRFIGALEDGINYYSKYYGTLSAGNITIAETSNYGPYMSTFPGLITYAEYFGWNADINSPDVFDYCYFQTARQFSKQWWDFQLHVSSSPGSKVITEGLPTYDALVLLEKKVGLKNMKKILQYELDHYLIPSAREKKTILLHSDKNFNYDAKAAFVLFGLRSLIGENKINLALRSFYNTFSSSSNIQNANSNDLYHYLKSYTPDSLKYYLKDNWENITYYDNKVLSVTTEPINQGMNYEVTAIVSTDKIIENDNMKQTSESMNDQIDLAIYGKDKSDILFLKNYKFQNGTHTVKIIITKKPYAIGIDPYMQLIDKNTNDNFKEIK